MLHRMKLERALKIKEVQKQLDVSFCRVFNYPNWVGNIILVPKKGGRTRICGFLRFEYGKSKYRLSFAAYRLASRQYGRTLLIVVHGWLC